MTALRRLVARLLRTPFRGRFEARLREEIADHISRRAAEYERQGLSPAEGRRRAELEFGSPQIVAEDYRAELALPFGSVVGDVRYALRGLRRSPGFAAVALSVLAFGIGANTVIFSAVSAILLERFPYEGGSRNVVVRRAQAAWYLTPDEGRAIGVQCPAFESVAMYGGSFATLTLADGTLVHRQTSRVSRDFFSMLGAAPLIGRTIGPADVTDAPAMVAVLSYRLWRDGFGADRGVLDHDVLIDQQAYRVVGVMPPDFEVGVLWGPESDEGLWTPMSSRPGDRENNGFVVARVRAGVPVATAVAQLNALSPSLARRLPAGADHTELILESPGVRVENTLRAALLILEGAVAFVLLLASVNVSALLTARGWARQRELTIRRALGASRSRLIRQLVTESLVLAFGGCVIGVLLSIWGLEALRAFAPVNTPRIDRWQIDGRVLCFSLGLAFIAALVFGVLPAFHASSARAHRAATNVRGASAGLARTKPWLGRGLVVLEVALAVVLLVGGVLMLRSFDRLMQVDTGVKSDHVVMVSVEDRACREKTTRDACQAQTVLMLERLAAVPGIQHVALATSSPLGGGFYSRAGLTVGAARVAEGFAAAERSVSGEFFSTVGMWFLAGRVFQPGEHDVAVVNETFAHKYVTGNPVGQRFSASTDAQGNPVWLTIVGEVNDTRDRSIDPAMLAGRAAYYEPLPIAAGRWMAIARTSTDPYAVVSAVKHVISERDPRAVFESVKSMDDAIKSSSSPTRFQTLLLSLFGGFAGLLAVLGIYGVTAYSVVQRMQEIGVRRALGARTTDLLRLLAGETGALALAGVICGSGIALLLAPSLRSVLFEIQPTDVTTFLLVGAGLFVAAIIAALVPARRAASVDPLAALRHE